jgi:hypothetical protein
LMKGLRQAHTRYTGFIQGNDLPWERSVYLVIVRDRGRGRGRGRGMGYG